VRTRASGAVTFASFNCVDAIAEPFEADPEDQRPAADIFDLLLDLVDKIGRWAGEGGVAVGRGAGGKAGAETTDEAV
jgi:hypothetical protein